MSSEEKYRELAEALRERDKAIKKVKALEKRIEELIGLSDVAESRKPQKKTFSAREFAKGCGV